MLSSVDTELQPEPWSNAAPPRNIVINTQPTSKADTEEEMRSIDIVSNPRNSEGPNIAFRDKLYQLRIVSKRKFINVRGKSVHEPIRTREKPRFKPHQTH